LTKKTEKAKTAFQTLLKQQELLRKKQEKNIKKLESKLFRLQEIQKEAKLLKEHRDI